LSARITYQVCLERAIIELRDKNLDRKARRNDRTQRSCRKQGKGDLKKLSLHTLGGRENTTLFTSAFIGDFLLRLELTTFGSNCRDILCLPPAAEVDLLTLPIFHKYDTPKAVDSSIDEREATKKEPAREPKYSREDQKSEV
jgi:hypothetical protein